MNATEPLVALLAQGERQRDLALSDEHKARVSRDATRAQAEQLVAYRREYEQRWHARFCAEGKIELVRCYQGFIERLTHAVDQQQRAAEAAETELTRTIAVVRDAELRLKGIRKLIERRIAEQDEVRRRVEARGNDEIAARMSRQQQQQQEQRPQQHGGFGDLASLRFAAR